MPRQARELDQKRYKQALEACRDSRELAMFLLSTKAGLRSAEIAGLTWDRCDFDQGVLLLTKTKGDKYREVPISKHLRAALEAWRDEQSPTKRHVFTNRHRDKGKPLTANAVAVWFRSFYRDRLGWEGYSSHSGRRSFVTNTARKIVEVGGSLRDVQSLAGHASLQTTQRYIAVNTEAKRKVVDLI